VLSHEVGGVESDRSDGVINGASNFGANRSAARLSPSSTEPPRSIVVAIPQYKCREIRVLDDARRISALDLLDRRDRIRRTGHRSSWQDTV
jgi:hypothetical protein